MGLGSLFSSRSVNGAVAVSDAEVGDTGYFRVAFPSWSIPGVRVVSDLPEVDRTTRREIETVFSLELNRARVGNSFSPAEARELDLAREIRRALYDMRAAA